MNRFSVLYLLSKKYEHIPCATHDEANAVLQQMLIQEEGKPIGIYDDKTELFYWEPIQQRKYNHADIEHQGKLGEKIITIAQNLRLGDKAATPATNSISQLLQPII